MKDIIKNGLIILIAISFTHIVNAAQTENMSGRIYAQSNRNLLPLGNGDGVQIISTDGVIAMSGEPPTIYGITCAGMGIVDLDGNIDMNVYCTITATGDDVLDILGTLKGDGSGGIKVIGGSGKYEGATGSGSYRPFDEQSNEQGQGIIELQVRTR